MNYEQYNFTECKDKGEIETLVNQLVDDSVEDIHEIVNPTERLVNEESDHETLVEECDEITKKNVGFVAGLGLAHNVSTVTDDLRFYVSIIEHRDWFVRHQPSDLFDRPASYSNPDTQVAQIALTTLYSRVRKEVYDILTEELEEARSN